MRCFWIFFHDWKPWCQPYTVHRVPIDEVGCSMGPGYDERRQVRFCQRCNRVQSREVTA